MTRDQFLGHLQNLMQANTSIFQDIRLPEAARATAAERVLMLQSLVQVAQGLEALKAAESVEAVAGGMIPAPVST